MKGGCFPPPLFLLLPSVCRSAQLSFYLFDISFQHFVILIVTPSCVACTGVILTFAFGLACTPFFYYIPEKKAVVAQQSSRQSGLCSLVLIFSFFFSLFSFYRRHAFCYSASYFFRCCCCCCTGHSRIILHTTRAIKLSTRLLNYLIVCVDLVVFSLFAF